MTVERRKNKYNRMVSLSEAVVVVKVDGEKKLSVSESVDEEGNDRGPVNALSKALAKDLGSAAVTFAPVMTAAVWGLILYDRFGHMLFG